MRMHQILASIVTLALSASIAFAGGDTAFTYQGRLLDAGEPANGLFVFEFTLYDAEIGGNETGGPIEVIMPVSDGLFTLQIDFGADAFDNAERWLEIAVGVTILSPRQPITRAPYSIQTRGIVIGDDGNVLFNSMSAVEGTVTFSSIGGIDLILDADTDNVGEDQNARIVMMQDGGLVAARMGYREGGNTLELMQEHSGHLILGTNNEDRLTIEPSGNVGIGTTAPRFPLHVVSAENTTILGRNTSIEGGAHGVTGESLSTQGLGVRGVALSPTGPTAGVFGVTLSPSGYGVFSIGDFGGNGAKYFVQPHPNDPSKEIRFVCLEGNESGTYFRGSTRLEGGRAYIDVPEEFRLVSELDGLTVQVTAKGPNAGLWVESSDLHQVVVGGNGNVEFDYFVNGVRRGFADLELIRENHAYVPEVRGVPYGTQYRPGHRQILVENGILNPDFTPNEATAAMMGWTLRDPEPDELSRAASSTNGESR